MAVSGTKEQHREHHPPGPERPSPIASPNEAARRIPTADSRSGRPWTRARASACTNLAAQFPRLPGSTPTLLKNIGNPMIAPTSAIAQGRARGDACPTMVSTISSAPPESASNLANIAPKRDQDADAGRCRAEPVGEGFQHLLQVRTRDDADRQRAEDQRGERCSLTTVIKTTITAIPARKANISCQPDATAVSRVKVSAYGHGVVSNGGVGMLREVAELTGLSAEVTALLVDTYRGHGSTSRVRCSRIWPRGRRRGGLHGRRWARRWGDRERVFGAAASSTTMWRWSMRPSARIRAARAHARPPGPRVRPRCRSVAAPGCRCHHHYRPSEKRGRMGILNTTDGWSPAIESRGGIRDGAWVAEATGLVEMSSSGPG